MKTYALVGKTGTGKSYRALDIAGENKIDAIIDDGLLISCGRILAGSSAKLEKTRIASVKRAIFAYDDHALQVKNAIFDNHFDSLLILGTSEKMVTQIAEKLDLLPFQEIFRIENISTPDEIKIASTMRNVYGKHVIPAPVFEVKKQFSGYFLKSLISGKKEFESEKTVMRPTYSYLGNFRISPKVFEDIAGFEALRVQGISKVFKIKSISDSNNCIKLYLEISVLFPCDIPELSKILQKKVKNSIEATTSITVTSVDVFVKTLTFS